MLWLMEALVTGLEAFYIQWDNRPMKQFRTNYPPSVSLGALWFPINIILFIFFFPENWKLVFMVCYLLLIQLFSLAVIYGAGLVTSLSPCTLSVLPLTLGYIGKLAVVLNFQYQNLLRCLNLLVYGRGIWLWQKQSRGNMLVTVLFSVLLISFYDPARGSKCYD